MNRVANGSVSRELQHLRSQIERTFQAGRWSELAGALETLAKIGEAEGHRELCLRAQSLRELMGHNAGGREAPGKRVSELYHDLLFHVSHVEWSKAQTPRKGGLAGSPSS